MMAVTSASVLNSTDEMESAFNDSNSTASLHNVTQMVMHNSTDVPRETEGISNVIIGTLILMINAILIKALLNNRRTLNWKRYACILNLAISDFMCGSVLVIRGFTDLFGNASTEAFDAILNLEVGASIFMTILNYDCELCVQYLAIKEPMFYHTKLTLPKILFVISVLWFFILSYTALHIFLEIFCTWDGTGAMFKYIEMTAMGLSMIFNSIFYSYVLKVVAQKRHESLMRRQMSERLSSIKLSISSISDSESSAPTKQSVFYEYNSVITLGIQLITYISTISPLFIYWIYSSIYGYNNFDTGRKVIDVVFESFWFVRAILDPLTFLLRERRLLSTCTLPNCCGEKR